MNWIHRNLKTIIITAFLIPIITVAVVSISHVTQWYAISNPPTWALYLSIGIEIAALSALAALSVKMGSKVYFPFIVVTIIQFIGNIFFSYSYIKIDSEEFKNWVNLTSPIMEFIGVKDTDFVGHKRILALFSGGILPLISLSFLHMLVRYEESQFEKDKTPNQLKPVQLTEEDLSLLETQLNKMEEQRKIKEGQFSVNVDVSPIEEEVGIEEKIEEETQRIIQPEEFVSSNFLSKRVTGSPQRVSSDIIEKKK